MSAKTAVICVAVWAILGSGSAFSEGDSRAVDDMRACGAEAKAKGLMGDARKTFMATCLQARADAAPPMIGAGRAATTKEATSAKEAVLNQLKDPAAAQFRNITYHERTRAVCGEVNGKNAYGGYVGFRPFAFADGRATVMPSGDVALKLDAEKAIREACE